MRKSIATIPEPQATLTLGVAAGLRASLPATIDADLVNSGLVLDSGEHVQLSERGKLVYDLVTLAFYPAKARAWLTEREPVAAFVDFDLASA